MFNGGGFDTSLLAPFIVKSIHSDTALPQNTDALTRLREHIKGAAQPPSAGLLA